MKAEINENNQLVLILEDIPELDKLKQWIVKSSGKVTIPESRNEFAITKFNSLGIVICINPELKV